MALVATQLEHRRKCFNLDSLDAVPPHLARRLWTRVLSKGCVLEDYCKSVANTSGMQEESFDLQPLNRSETTPSSILHHESIYTTVSACLALRPTFLRLSHCSGTYTITAFGGIFANQQSHTQMDLRP